MGDRSNVFFQQEPGVGIGVYFHWGGTGVADAVSGLSDNRGFMNRLGDEQYATRIGVQSVMDSLGIRASVETGCGIWFSDQGHDGEYRLVVVDVENGDVHVTASSESLETSAETLVGNLRTGVSPIEIKAAMERR